MPDFTGFSLPEQNSSKMPHALIEALPAISSLSEMKVILYILRHTWGYHEFDIPKKITLDEFMNGRKYSPKHMREHPGSAKRMDGGVGMSKPAIIDGLKRALDDGFIEVDVDDWDKGRVKKSYSLRMKGSNSFTSEPTKSNANGSDPLPRSEKETIETNHREKDIWHSCMLEFAMMGPTYVQLLYGSELLSYTDETATIRVRSQYAVDWCANRLRVPITRTLAGVVGDGWAGVVEFVTTEEATGEN